MTSLERLRRSGIAIAASALLFASQVALGAATIIIQNGNAAGVGFNDPTPVAPVGGNTGTTLGQQRLNAFQFAANIWGATIDSVPPIVVLATFEPLTCTPTGAVLGSAGPLAIYRDFTGATVPNTWYHVALANKLFGADLDDAVGDPFPEIGARFNVNLGAPTCLAGSPFYLGLDNAHGSAIDLVTVLLHEFAHGLGFSTVTSGTSGNFVLGFPSIYDFFTFDNTQGLTWTAMTPAQRVASAVNARRVVWIGANVTAAAPSVLASGTPQLVVSGNFPAVNGIYDVGAATFGPPIGAPVTGHIMPVVDQSNGTGLACTPLNALNALAVNGNIALIDRGVCTFPEKVKNAQNAGARGVLIAENVAGSPPVGLGGADPTITIPSARITLADANKIKAALQFRSRNRSGVIGTLSLDLTRLAGADAAGRVLLFTPNPFQGGSSVSHWDTSAFPNLLMEPSINVDLTHSVVPPFDLTFPQLRDIGW